MKGLRWTVGSSNHGCWLGSYERDQQALFESWVKEGDVVFDIGAHVGLYTLLGSVLVGRTGKVVAFEPVPGNLSFLKKHLKINAISNAEIMEAAVSDRSGRVKLATGQSSSMFHFDANGELEVRAVTLDELVQGARLPPPDLIKMDIEGAEFLALNGGAWVIRQFHPVFILSTHGADIHRRCCGLLESSGYRLTPIGRASIDDCRELLAVHNGG